MKRKDFLPYNQKELIDSINKIEILKINQTVITKYDDKIKSTSNVSDRYEIFDIKKFLLNKIDDISNNFEIKEYSFNVYKGVQDLILLSDIIEIHGHRFQKVLSIINSTDRTKRLCINVGLRLIDKDIFLLKDVKNVYANKKHFKGISEYVYNESLKINDETFEEQVEYISKLINHKVSLFNVYKVFMKDKFYFKDHINFDKLKKSIIYNKERFNLTKEQEQVLFVHSTKFSELTKEHNFFLDAFEIFKLYMNMWKYSDTAVIRREADMIYSITQHSIRKEKIKELFA
jgi:hypothetical protein